MEFLIALILTGIIIYIINLKQNNTNQSKKISDSKNATLVKIDSSYIPYEDNVTKLLDTRPFYDFLSESFERSELRGIKAEKEVSNFLRSGGFKYIENYTFNSDGIIYKIDHLVINEKGLFIIETKRWRGIISKSTEFSKFIVKSKKFGSKRYNNPIKEHIKLKNELKKIINEDDSIMTPIIFFKDAVMLDFETKQITAISKFEELKKEILKKSNKLSNERIEDIISKLNACYHPISRVDYYKIIHN